MLINPITVNQYFIFLVLFFLFIPQSWDWWLSSCNLQSLLSHTILFILLQLFPLAYLDICFMNYFLGLRLATPSLSSPLLMWPGSCRFLLYSHVWMLVVDAYGILYGRWWPYKNYMPCIHTALNNYLYSRSVT